MSFDEKCTFPQTISETGYILEYLIGTVYVKLGMP